MHPAVLSRFAAALTALFLLHGSASAQGRAGAAANRGPGDAPGTGAVGAGGTGALPLALPPSVVRPALHGVVPLAPSLRPGPARVGIYGGTFDPVHSGHLGAVESAIEALDLDRVVVFPNLIPLGKEGALPFETRYELLARAVKGHPQIELPPMETLRELLAGEGGVDRLRAWAAARSPGALMHHIMGTDSYRKLQAMAGARRVLEDPEGPLIVVVEREGHANPAGRLPERVRLVRPRGPSFSSTEVRGDPVLAEAKLPRTVALGIRRLGLYGRGPERSYHDLPEHLRRLLDWEQTVNDRIEDLSRFDSIRKMALPPEQLPERRPVFRLWTVEVPESEVRIVAAGPLPAQVAFERGGRRFVRFFIHPVSEGFFRKRLAGYEWRREYLATPMASHRSLVAWNPSTREPPLGLKVSLDAKVGGMTRLVTRRQIERGTAAAALIRTIKARELAGQGIRFMDEPGGVLLNGREFGFSVRSLPSEIPEGTDLVPMFSLYSKPIRGPPLVVALARSSGLGPRRFIEEVLVRPLVAQAAWLAFGHGLVGEPHEQNVLIELRHGRPTGSFWYRDFSGYSISPGLRAAAGLGMDFLPPGISPDSMKSKRADLVDSLETFLRASSFYALQKAMELDFPEVTASWLDKAFESALAREVSRHTGVKAAGLAGSRRAIWLHLKRAAPGSPRPSG